MACSESKNNISNAPAEVEEILNTVLTDGDEKQPRFVTFILTKCEKWMADGKGREKLAKKFHACYDPIISMLNDADNPPKIDMLAIQTMGGVEYKENDENGEPVFVVVEKNLKPKDCAYPLVLLLRYLIKDLVENTSILAKILIALGFGTDLGEYLETLKHKVKAPLVHEEL